jgi:hypothetical protein
MSDQPDEWLLYVLYDTASMATAYAVEPFWCDRGCDPVGSNWQVRGGYPTREEAEAAGREEVARMVAEGYRHDRNPWKSHTY